ncbi:MAG: hypothetical protein JW825_00675 [Candidatus Methanofastidiosa archaeon]|nr:hypothetical protein [Candidatus Methanofastidiosa archaeon]
MKWKRIKDNRKKTAMRHVERLLELSLQNLDEHPERAKRYVEIARDIILKHKVSLPLDKKRLFCKECNTPLVPGKTARVRTRAQRVSITCLNCGNVKRYPFYKEKRQFGARRGYAEKKYPGGLVCVELAHKDGQIRRIKITGDFFFYPEERLSDLEHSLVKAKVSDVGAIIGRFYRDEKIESPGMGPESLAEVIEMAAKAKS